MPAAFPHLSWLKNKTVVVTGGSGFIGSHLCERLLNEGATVYAIDNFLTGNRENVSHLVGNPAFHLIEANVIDPTETFLDKVAQIDLLLHFASPASPPKYQAEPITTYLVNSYATHLMLQYLLKKHPAARFLFASTSEVYGDPAVHPQVESYWGNVNPNGMRSCYDEAKRLGETICGVHARDFGMDVRLVRIFNTYGPRMDLHDGRIIPSFISSVLEGRPLVIFGDGSQTRSFCYVDDLVEGILRLACQPEASGATVNLGNPGEFTVLETAHVLEEIVGHKLELEYQPLPKDDPTRRQPDISRAKELLDWEPIVVFKDGLKRTLESFR